MQKKTGRESFFGRWATGRRTGGPGRNYGPYFYILHAPAEYKNDLGISGCGGNLTNCSRVIAMVTATATEYC